MTRISAVERRHCIRLAAIPEQIREATFAACRRHRIAVSEKLLLGAARQKRLSPEIYIVGEAIRIGVLEALRPKAVRS